MLTTKEIQTQAKENNNYVKGNVHDDIKETLQSIKRLMDNSNLKETPEQETPEQEKEIMNLTRNQLRIIHYIQNSFNSLGSTYWTTADNLCLNKKQTESEMEHLVTLGIFRKDGTLFYVAPGQQLSFSDEMEKDFISEIQKISLERKEIELQHKKDSEDPLKEELTIVSKETQEQEKEIMKEQNPIVNESLTDKESIQSLVVTNNITTKNGTVQSIVSRNDGSISITVTVKESSLSGWKPMFWMVGFFMAIGSLIIKYLCQ